MNKTLAIIGGSGLYDLTCFQSINSYEISTPWGMPSDKIYELNYETTKFFFLPRHGSSHTISPSRVNYRANIDALKQLNVTDVLSISAVGSLNQNINPGVFVIIDQYIDQTKIRHSSFFDDGIVAHVSMAYPTDDDLMRIAEASLISSNITFKKGGTYLCMEGPQFSSLAESKLYKSWDCDVIGMTNMPEAKLCREADIRYVSIGMVTDYDCWNKNYSKVAVDNVLEILKSNTEKSKEMIKMFISHYSNQRIDNKLDIYKSIVTPLSNIKIGTITKLKNIIPKLYKDVIKETKT
jgi:5'-methylthioadenosine phosphorylase